MRRFRELYINNERYRAEQGRRAIDSTYTLTTEQAMRFIQYWTNPVATNTNKPVKRLVINSFEDWSRQSAS